MKPQINKLSSFIALFIIMIISPVAAQQTLKSTYQFHETVDLIKFVERAAEYFEENGKSALVDFSEENSQWFKGNHYIFIYDLEGNCFFHPVQKEFVGKNMLHLKDMNGKPIIQYIVDIAKDTAISHGWIHYLWAEGGDFFPSWKSGYIKRVKSPDGQYYALGSGKYDIRPEKKFMMDIVDSAATLVEREGTNAYTKLMEKSSIYYFMDIYVFVIDMKGKALIDPVFPGISGRDMMDFQDVMGKYVVVEMIEKLKNTDRASIIYLWPRPGQSIPSKKVVYIRKVKVKGEDVIVGSSLFNVEPIWKLF